MASDDTTLSNLTALGGQPARAMRTAQTRKVAVITLCTDRQFVTQGSTTYKNFVVGPRVLQGVGPLLESIAAQGRGKDFSTNFRFKLVGEYSVDGELFSAFGGTIIGETTAQGNVVPTPHSTLTDYGNDLRFSVAVSNTTGTAVESGNLSLFVSLKFAT